MATCAITKPGIRGKARAIGNLYDQNNRKKAREKLFELCQQIKYSSNDDNERIDFVNTLVESLKRNGATTIDSNITFSYLNNVIMSDNSSMEYFVEQSRTSQIFDDPEEFSNIQQAPFKFLEDAYGSSSAKRPALSEQENNLIDVILFGRQGLNLPHQRVLNISQLNDNIRAYQQYLFENIVKYFEYLKDNVLQNTAKQNIENDLKDIFESSNLYIQNGSDYVESGQLDVLSKYINTYLNLSPDTLTDLYNNTAYKNDGSADKIRLDAYNSYVFLQNYDHFLLSIFGKSIQINDFGKLTGKDKYTLNKGTGKNTTNWNTDNMDVADQADVLTKLVLNHTPYYKRNSVSPVIGKFVSFQNFQHITGKIKSLYFNTAFANLDFKNPLVFAQYNLSNDATNYLSGKTFRQALAEVKYNYRDRIGYIYELILNNNFYDSYSKELNELFTEDEINILYSVYKGVYQKGTNSIFELSKTPGLFDMASYISSTAVDIYNNELVQFYRSSDNNIVARTLTDQSISNIKRQFETSIQLWNMQDRFTDYDAYLNRYFQQIQETESAAKVKTIVFTMRNGMDIKFTPSTLNVNTRLNYNQKWEFVNLILAPLNLNRNTDFLNAIIQKYDSKQDVIDRLFDLAINVLGNSYISAKHIEGLNNKTDINNVINEYFGTKSVPKFNNKTLDFIHGRNTKTLQILANTQADLSGLTTATLVKSGDKKNQSKQTLSRLYGSFFEQFELQDKQEDAAVRNLTLLSQPNYFKGIFQAKEYFDSFGNIKDVTNMNAAEMFFPMFITNYMMQYSTSDGILGNGLGAFLISVNSDKPNISCMITDLNARIFNGKSLNQLTTVELDQLISNEFGNVYRNIINNILEDFNTFYDILKLNGNDEISLIWKNKKALQNDFFNDFKKFNAYCQKLNITPSSKMYELRRQFEDISNTPVDFIDQIHYYSDKSGNIRSNKTLISQLYRFMPEYFSKMNNSVTEGMADYKSFWKYKECELLQGILRYNININTIDTIQEGVKQLKARSHPNDPKLENRWIDNAGDIIWAKYKTKGGEIYNITDQQEYDNLVKYLKEKYKTNFDDHTLLTYDDFGTLTIHPELSKYNKLAYFNSQSFMLSTVGTFAAHPGKGSFANVLEEEAARFNAQHKRNVSMTAAMHSFLLNTINGVPTNYNISIIEDIFDTASTIHGETSSIKAFDGATFVNPFMVILENNSLEGSAAGITKKQFIHYYNRKYGTGGIIKTAGFGLTNDWIRNSPYLQRMMEKMTDREWPDMYNIMDSRSYYRGVDPKELYKPIYFKRNGKNYTIDINTVEMDSPYHYKYMVWEVAENGEPINGTGHEEYTNITTNYELWKFFGGEYSMELKNGVLKYSNISVEQVVTAMNEIGSLVNKNANINNVLTQEDVYQPLKHTDIHYIPTAGAVKFGGANINTVATFESDDQPLSTTQVEILQAGIQLDKEHHADDAEISLMTQVISACASLGYTYDSAAKVYEALAAANINNTKDYYQGLNALFNDDSSKIKELINKTLIDELVNSKNESIAKNMALSLQKKIKNGEIKLSDNILPLSDNTIYAKLISTINSFLTNSGIKSKIPGILSVLTPGYKMNKLYAGKKYEQFQNPEQELQELQNKKEANPEFDESQFALRLKSVEETDEEYYNYRKSEILKNNPFASLRFGTTYTIQFKNGEVIQLELNTIEKYQKLKSDVFSGNVSKFYENIKVGRELAPYNSRFEIYQDGEEPIKAQLWDIDSINDLNRLKHAIKLNDTDTIDWIAQYYFDENQLYLITDYNTKTKLLLKRINARLQQDLLNLSTNVNPIYDQFKEAVNIFRNSDNPNVEELQNKICLLLHLNPRNNPIITNGEFDEQAFKKIENYALQTRQVSIGRKFYNINKDSIQIEPYEVIMSKTFQSAFGLDEDTQLSDIINDPLYFLKQFQRNLEIKVDDSNYDIVFKRFDGRHTYVINRNSADFQNATQIIPLTVKDDDGTIWRLDSKYNKMYQINQDDTIYEKDGQEIIVTNNVQSYIDNLNYDVIQFSRNIVQNDQNPEETVQRYMNMLENSDNRIAKSVYNELNYELYDYGVFKANFQNQFFQNVDRINTVELDDATNFLYKQSVEKYNSFLTALNIVAARVPAQSMQSFMTMKIVAFENADINTVYVNTMQLLLQGSDFDIDTVNLVTYDINNNGLLDLPSPFARIDSQEHIRESFRIPFPNGKMIPINERFNSIDPLYDILDKYRDLFSLRFAQVENGKLDFNKVTININPERFDLLVRFLQEGNNIRLLEENDTDVVFENTDFNTIFNNQNENQFDLNDAHNLNIILQALIDQVINKHNLYFNTLSYNKIERIVNNYSTANMIDTIRTPVNQMQGHISVDGTTGPIKKVGDRSNNAKLTKERTAGNFLNQIESITDNQIGKTCIGICAVALKSFFATTQYCNTVLNYGDTKEQGNLLSSNQFVDENGRTITYQVIANLHSKNVNSITNTQLLRALSYAQYNEEDAAVLLSALLSLSTDNAKELTLAKLNAVSQMISLYLYGISIGIPFNSLANTIMSPAGDIIIKVMQGNMFTGKNEFLRISDSVFNFIENCQDKNLLVFNKSYLSNKDKIVPAYNKVLDLLRSQFADDSDVTKQTLGGILSQLVINKQYSTKEIDDILTQKIKVIISNIPNNVNKIASIQQLYALKKRAMQAVQELYILASDAEQSRNYDNIKMLTEGASEIYTLGRLLRLNQGIRTESTKYISQLNVLRYAIYNKLPQNERETSDIIDIERYCMDSEYRKECIEKYENVKTSINVLGVLEKNPHFKSYLANLAESLAIHKQGYKFRSIYDNVLQLSNDYSMPQDQITSGLSNLISDQIINNYLQGNDISVIIDPGVKYFTSETQTLKTENYTTLRLGNSLNNATFKNWVEINLIAELKQRPELSDNKFIQDLVYDLNTRTTSHNSENIIALPSTMLPRTDAERTLFNEYKQAFNQLSIYTKNGIPLTDIFILYGMIVNRWRLSERSLVPLFQDFKDTRLISRFYNYESILDASGDSFDIDHVDENIKAAYLAKPESPFYSRAKYIWYKNPETKLYQLMKHAHIDQQDLNDEFGDYEIDDINLIDIDFSPVDENNFGRTIPNDWEYMQEIPNPKKFPSGDLFKESHVFKKTYLDIELGIGIEYYNDGTIKRISQFKLKNGGWVQSKINSKLLINKNQLLSRNPQTGQITPNEDLIDSIMQQKSCSL